MKIFVDGISRNFVSPNKVVMNLNFRARGATYDEAVSKGINNVSLFNSLVLLPNGLKEEDLKTRNFSVFEDRFFNQATGENEIRGYVFNQNAVLRLDYDNELINSIITSISEAEDAPEVNLSFVFESDDKNMKPFLEEAYNDAKRKATDIAEIAGKAIKEVVSAELKNTNANLLFSNSNFGGDVLKSVNYNSMNMNYIHPEDIEIQIILSCVFEAE